MSAVLIDHPDDWIGIPENWPNERWTTPYEWASELVQAFAEDFPPPADDELPNLRDVLVSVAHSLDKTESSRLYVSVDAWTGPLYVAEMANIPADRVIGFTPEEIAGADDDRAIEKPLVEPFSTTDGIEGVRCIRYLQASDVDGILARIDYVFPVPDGFVRFSTSQYDLVEFEREQPRMDELARTLRVAE